MYSLNGDFEWSKIVNIPVAHPVDELNRGSAKGWRFNPFLQKFSVCLLFSTTAQWQTVLSDRSLRGQAKATVAIVCVCSFYLRLRCDYICSCTHVPLATWNSICCEQKNPCLVFIQAFSSAFCPPPSCHLCWWPPVCVADIFGSLRIKSTHLAALSPRWLGNGR